MTRVTAVGLFVLGIIAAIQGREAIALAFGIVAALYQCTALIVDAIKESK